MLAGEYTRIAKTGNITLTQGAVMPTTLDPRSWYAMATYKPTEKLNVGVYAAQAIDHGLRLGTDRDFHDWVISSRYDPSQFLYLKVEQHFINGTELGINTPTTGNPTPTTRLTVLKVGVAF